MPYQGRTRGNKNAIRKSKRLPEKETIVDKEKLKSCAGDIQVIAEDLQVITANIKSSDDALMFSWLGPAREYFFDVSTCVQSRITLTSEKWEESSQLLETVVSDRTELDATAAEATQ